MDFDTSKKLMENAVRAGSYLGLERINALLHELGDPQLALKCVHVAGTDGKGSTVAMLSSVLTEAGYRTGRYISPALFYFNERISVDGVDITDSELESITGSVKSAAFTIDKKGFGLPTEFEFVTALAFAYYARRKCDIVILETGMGGRLDATNTVKNPECCVITSIGYDHMAELGNTLALIAGEKAGIIKQGCDVVSYPQRDEAAAVIFDVCKRKSAKLHTINLPAEIIDSSINGQTFNFGLHSGIKIPLLGAHQVKNASVVLKVIDVLRDRGWNILESAVCSGMQNVKWQGRVDVISRDPVFIFDGSHNPQKVSALVQTLRRLGLGDRYLFVMGVMADKDYVEMLRITAPMAEDYFTMCPSNPRSLSGAALAEAARAQGSRAEKFEVPADALDAALNACRETGLPVCCFGSLYSAKEVYGYFGRKQQ